MSRRTLLFALPLACALLARCAAFDPSVLIPLGDAGVDAGPRQDAGRMDAGVGPTGLELSSACATLNRARCEYLLRCRLISGNDAIRQCVELFDETRCSPSGWPALVSLGKTLRYDGLQALACANAYAAFSCAEPSREPTACALGGEPGYRFLSPASPLGGRCYGGPIPECREGAVCRGQCPGSCLNPGSLGDACDEDTDCGGDGGLYCSVVGSSASGSCAPFGALSAACDSLRRCGSGLVCSPDTNACATPGKVGEPCSANTCGTGLWCAYVPSDGGSRCAAQANDGVACTSDVQCRTGSICQTPPGACAPMGPIPDGGSCSEKQTCAGGLTCAGATASALGRCEVAHPEGAACATPQDCEGHLTCARADGGARLCVPRLADAEPCASSRDCKLYSRCINSSCTPLPRPGEPCPFGACLYGVCDASKSDGGSLCLPPLGPGSACLRDADCASSRCFSNRCLALCAP